jgi:hypothetical protein
VDAAFKFPVCYESQRKGESIHFWDGLTLQRTDGALVRLFGAGRLEIGLEN